MGIDIARARAEKAAAEAKTKEKQPKAAKQEIPPAAEKPGITKCRACGKDVSTAAKACPHCGDPREIQREVSPKKKSTSLSTGIITILGLIALAIYLFGGESGKSTSGPSADPKQAAISAIDFQFSWRHVAGGSFLEADFTLTNKGIKAVKDIEISCSGQGASGTKIDTNKRTIYENLGPGETKRFDKFSMGMIHSQVQTLACSITDLKL